GIVFPPPPCRNLLCPIKRERQYGLTALRRPGTLPLQLADRQGTLQPQDIALGHKGAQQGFSSPSGKPALVQSFAVVRQLCGTHRTVLLLPHRQPAPALPQ